MTRSDAALLAEVPEAEASGPLAAIYQDIKTQLQLPVVNLIYRHMATVPGCLEWVWASIRPAMADGSIAEAARDLAENCDVQPLAELPPAALAALGVEAETERQIRHILSVYNRANPRNLVSAHCLLRLLERDEAATPAADEPIAHIPLGDVGGDAAPPPEPELPPIVDLAQTGADTQTLVLEMSGGRRDSGKAIVPSLYRHLAHWPGFLAVEWTLLRPLVTDGAVELAATSVTEQAAAAAARIVDRHNDPLPRFRPLPAGTREQLTHHLQVFVPTISTMVVIGALVSRSLPPAQ